ncbi:ABC transporter substrate-binding protein [Aliarcobacter lanthieri]|uniref:ABC transporter substrate-binding protein n=1 Tax=Aliarcobacter lanthieri TaxID=1355374 RepID=UPI00047DEC0E|nr:ABC transporter substrate-binding protein [Aliarcobacter lanthieri]QKF59802.1 BvgS-like domain-containing signal transduction sensor histidine kinase (NMT1 domain) [Aliarcobacter lanthieri]
MKFSLNLKFFLIFIIFSINLYSKDLKKVSLQLAWFDQFQYAGYYIAKEKGFYEELGIDVEILPFSLDLDVPKKVNNQEVDFAIGRENLIVEKSRNKDIIILSALFQVSPLVLLSTKKSGIDNISKFKNKTMMTTLDDASEVSIKAMIVSNKVDISDINIFTHSHDINDLINKKTDLITAYTSKAPYWLEKSGIEYNVFSPKDYGFDLYSDFLYTSENYIKNNKDVVIDFKKASLKGWEYAYSNIEESVDIIFKKYNSQNLTKAELIFEANELKKLSYVKNTKLGDIKKEKFQRIYDLYNLMGLIENHIDINKYFFDFGNSETIKISSDEQKVLDKLSEIKMCSIPNILPYSQIDNKEFKGVVADYIELLQTKFPKPIKLVPTQSWSESLMNLYSNKCDILSFAVKPQIGETDFLYTKSYLKIPLVLLTSSSVSFIDNLSTLKNKKITINKNYELIDKLKDKYKDIEFISVNSFDEAIQNILSGDVFGHIDTIATSWYNIQTKYLSKISISGKIDESLNISIAVNKNKVEIYNLFEQLVQSIDEKQINDIINKWVYTKYESYFDFETAYKILAIFLIIFCIILYRQVFLNRMNKRLKYLVNLKTRQLKNVNKRLANRIKKEVDKNLEKDRILSQQQKMISMGQMIENIAHQWRQPLSIITTNASSLKLKKQLKILDDDELFKISDSIVNTSQYLSQTIDDFRYFFKPQKNKEIFDLDGCIKKSIELVNMSLIKNKIRLEYLSKSIKVFGYETELIQVLINIINNSKDALEQNRVENRLIMINLRVDEKMVFLEILDNAGGIKDEIINKVFEPYFTTKHQYQGTGIGLYMSNEIISKHMNGEIFIKNHDFIFENINYKGAMITIALNIIE